MLVSIVVLSLAALSFAGTALVLALKNGSLRVALETARTRGREQSEVIKEHRERIASLTEIAHSRSARISSLYDELASCDGDTSSVAVDGLRDLLSPPAPDDNRG